MNSSFTENDTGCCGGTSGSIGSGSSSNGSGSRNHRRSSFVVIPPMQICPGDLLVYSKVLTQRNNILGNYKSHNSNKSQYFYVHYLHCFFMAQTNFLFIFTYLLMRVFFFLSFFSPCCHQIGKDLRRVWQETLVYKHGYI
jgi:hypothetical protein